MSGGVGKRSPPPEAEAVGPVPKKAAWEQTNTVFTNEKGGMVGYDKDQVKKIIYEMSKDSPHFKNEQRKQQQTEAKIRRLLDQSKTLSHPELAGHTSKMDAKITSLLADRDLSRTWIHVDLDAFFASVAELEDPTLKTKPMGVGGMGMLSTANYVARKYGIRSAMPGFIAKRLCPELVFVRPDFRKYSEASQAVRTIFREYDENLECGSLDEAYLDVTSYCAEHGVSGPEVAAEMRARVLKETGLTCSCGVAPNSMLAKVCSDMNKPNGQFAVPPDPAAISRFLEGLSVRKVPGIGKVGQQELNALGVSTCSDLIQQRGLLSALFSEVAVDCFMEAGLGLGRTQHHERLRDGEVGRKGMSVERTFAVIHTTQDLEAKCCELAAKLSEELESENLRGKTLTLKLKPPTFEVKTRAVTLPAYVSSESDIRSAALKLLRAELPIQVRLMGLRMSNFLQLTVPPGQKSLASFFQPKQAGEKQDTASERVVDKRELALKSEAASAEEHSDQEPAAEAEVPSNNLRGPKSAKRMWVCQMCTFAENPWHFLRCLICDERRGSVLRVDVPTDPIPSLARASDATCNAPAQPSESSKPAESCGAGREDESATVLCSKCGQAIAASDLQQHSDYHYAEELSSKAHDSVKTQAGSRAPSRKGRQTITKFFRPAKTPRQGCG